MNSPRKWALIVMLSGAGAVAGCASSPTPPSDALSDAETAIYRAEQSGAAQSAALELQTAREHLNAAQTAARGDEEDDMANARRLAEKAAADAEVAMAKAELARAEDANEQIEDSIDALRSELANR